MQFLRLKPADFQSGEIALFKVAIPKLKFWDSLRVFSKLIALVAAALALSSQTTGRLGVRSEVSIENVFERVPFTVTLNIDHPRPEEVQVKPPDFAGMFSIESVRTSGVWAAAGAGAVVDADTGITATATEGAAAPVDANLIAGLTAAVAMPDAIAATAAAGEEAPFLEPEREPDSLPTGEFKHVTQIIYRLMPLKSGMATLGQFTVSAAGRVGATWPLQLTIQSAPGSLLPALRWHGPARLTVGQEAFFELELTNHEAVRAYTTTPLFEIEAPTGAIIERQPLAAAAASATAAMPAVGSAAAPVGPAVLRLRVIPLEAGNITLKGRSLYGAVFFTLPSFTFLAAPAAPPQLLQPEAAAQLPQAQTVPETPETVAVDVFGVQLSVATPVDARAQPFDWAPFEDDSADRTAGVAAVRRLWESGLYAEALARLRQLERDSLGALALRPLRRALEARLGFEALPNELWRPPALMVALFILVALCALALCARRSAERRREGSQPPPTRARAAAVVAGCCLAAAAAAASLWRPLCAVIPAQSAVLYETALFPLPEEATSEEDLPRLREGQFVKTGPRAARFVYVNTEASAGWVPAEKCIRY